MKLPGHSKKDWKGISNTGERKKEENLLPLNREVSNFEKISEGGGARLCYRRSEEITGGAPLTDLKDFTGNLKA